MTHLAADGQVAASTQNQALSALLLLYREVLQQDFGWLNDVVRAKKPKRLPAVFSPEEAVAVIAELHGVRWMMGMMLYGGGLRLKECLCQRVKDLDFERRQGCMESLSRVQAKVPDTFSVMRMPLAVEQDELPYP